MNKQMLRDFVKYSPTLFSAYRFCGSLAARALGTGVPVDRRKILFISFGGRRYDDSPRAIYEEMIGRPEFDGFKYVWAFVGDAPEIPREPLVVRTDTPAFFHEAAGAGIWVTNASVERGLRFKRQDQVCVNTWHGTPIKRIGSENRTQWRTRVPSEHERFDLLCAQSEFDRVIMSRVFRVSMDKVLACGLPRNDSLTRYTNGDIARIRDALGIPDGKRVLLYAPTFREYERDALNTPILRPPITLPLWEERLGDGWVLLVRAHYLMTEGLPLAGGEFARDVSGYEPLNDLYAVADAMVSDYSSTFFDYAILGRPMFCFAYDYEEYAARRGLYEQAMRDLPCEVDCDEEALLSHITGMDYGLASARTCEFRDRYVPRSGGASRAVVDEVVTRFLDGSVGWGRSCDA